MKQPLKNSMHASIIDTPEKRKGMEYFGAAVSFNFTTITTTITTTPGEEW
jgi:hypothetical protein